MQPWTWLSPDLLVWYIVSNYKPFFNSYNNPTLWQLNFIILLFTYFITKDSFIILFWIFIVTLIREDGLFHFVGFLCKTSVKMYSSHKNKHRSYIVFSMLCKSLKNVICSLEEQISLSPWLIPEPFGGQPFNNIFLIF